MTQEKREPSFYGGKPIVYDEGQPLCDGCGHPAYVHNHDTSAYLLEIGIRDDGLPGCWAVDDIGGNFLWCQCLVFQAIASGLETAGVKIEKQETLWDKIKGLFR